LIKTGDVIPILEDDINIPPKKGVVVEFINDRLPKYDLDEFLALAKTANYDIIEEIIQKSQKISNSFLIGRGKVEEIAEKYENILKIDTKLAKREEKRKEEDLVFLFNNRLTPMQIVNLSGKLKARVIDRDLLILEIFETNARTKEAKIQVKLARMELEKSRLERILSEQLKSERQGRDFQGKGMGINQVVKRSMKYQKKKIMEQLLNTKRTREVQRKRRMKNAFVVSIIGYTNAGKTTFLNSIVDSNFKTKQTAFTTTTTHSRRVKMDGIPLVFTDTVGFVFDIPHQIIEAFLSTLEETKYSNMLLVLLDVSDPIGIIGKKIQTTFEVLAAIDALRIPIIFGINKIDRIQEKELEMRKMFISRILPENAKIYYFSALSKKSSWDLVKVLKKVKDHRVIIQNFQYKMENSNLLMSIKQKVEEEIKNYSKSMNS